MENGTYTVRPSELRTFGWILLSLVLTSLGVFTGMKIGRYGWFLAGIFGIGTIIFTIQLVSNSSYLLLTPEGITVHGVLHSYSYKWTDIEQFYVHWIFYKMVTFTFSDSCESPHIVETAARKIAGKRNILPNYGMNPEDLRDFLNIVREHFVCKNPFNSTAG